jgi:hypothetical protein
MADERGLTFTRTTGRFQLLLESNHGGFQFHQSLLEGSVLRLQALDLNTKGFGVHKVMYRSSLLLFNTQKASITSFRQLYLGKQLLAVLGIVKCRIDP